MKKQAFITFMDGTDQFIRGFIGHQFTNGWVVFKFLQDEIALPSHAIRNIQISNMLKEKKESSS